MMGYCFTKIWLTHSRIEAKNQGKSILGIGEAAKNLGELLSCHQQEYLV
jgi:hypothetical protein